MSFMPDARTMPDLAALSETLMTLEIVGPGAQREVFIQQGGTIAENLKRVMLALGGIVAQGPTEAEAMANWRAEARTAVARG